jgi:mRNA-degrading endonuclease YafQ of YafQ-DinJ toxin-antitoxin module
MKRSKYSIQATTRFQREFKKVVKRNMGLEERFLSVIERLSRDPFMRRLKTHAVNIPDFGRVYSSRVTGDIRIIWNFKDDTIIILHRIGGHSGGLNVYK